MSSTTRIAPRYVVTVNDDGTVSVFWRKLGQTDTYWCPMDGGAIRIDDCDGNQVCDSLQRRGRILSCPSRDELPRVIRREAKAKVRRLAERGEA